MAHDSSEEYDRDFSDPHQLPPEPVGWWGLSRRSRPWAREEDRWGSSGRGRERQARPSEEGGEWGGPGYGLGGGRRYGAWERPPESYGRGWSSREAPRRARWRGDQGDEDWRLRAPRARGRSSEDWSDRDVEAADREHGTGAWGPGQAEPGLWGRERRQRPPRQRYDRDLGSSDLRGRANRGTEWSDWGYDATRGQRPGERGRRRRTASDRWGQYRPENDAARENGAWDYGRHREHMLEATGEAARRGWRRSRPGRPDLREGEAWNEVGPGRWTRERRPRDRQGLAKEWDRGFYFGREDKGGGTPPSVGRHRWTPGSGRGPRGQENVEDYGPPGRDRGDQGERGW